MQAANAQQGIWATFPGKVRTIDPTEQPASRDSVDPSAPGPPHETP